MNEPIQLPTPNTSGRRYGCILADPPWNHNQVGAWGASEHYSLMTLERIKAMPIAELAAENSHCWLWVTNSSLRDGYDVLDAWGFQPRSILTWMKPGLGLGQYLRNSTEHVLFGIRGRAPVKFHSQPSWLWAPLQGHSHKPEEQYAIMERISDGPYLELFARRRQPGWHSWGNEVQSDVRIRGYPVPSDRSPPA